MTWVVVAVVLIEGIWYDTSFKEEHSSWGMCEKRAEYYNLTTDNLLFWCGGYTK